MRSISVSLTWNTHDRECTWFHRVTCQVMTVTLIGRAVGSTVRTVHAVGYAIV